MLWRLLGQQARRPRLQIRPVFHGSTGLAGCLPGSAIPRHLSPAYYPAYNSTLFLHNPHPPVQNGWINGWGAQYALFNPNDPNWVELDQKTLEPAINTMVLGQTPVAATLKHLTPQLTAGLSAHQHQH
jgi:hypothetical protein